MNRLLTVPAKYAAMAGLCSSVGIHVARYSGGDYIAQKREQLESQQDTSRQSSKFDTKRSLAFGAFGFYCGSVYTVIYGTIFSQILKRGVPALALVLVDYSVVSQIVYFPAYYMVQEVVQSPNPSLQSALRKCDENRWDDFTALLSIFMPFSWFNYAYVPTPWRGTFSGCAGVIWAMYLSSSRGELKEKSIVPDVRVETQEAGTEPAAGALMQAS
jgi:hypothetical protein